jgi:predicted DNA-binding WGR domain protein
MKKYFEFKDKTANSYKFWQIELKGKKITIQYGRIGIANPASMIKEFSTPEEAKKYSETVIREKTNKGYKEK